MFHFAARIFDWPAVPKPRHAKPAPLPVTTGDPTPSMRVRPRPGDTLPRQVAHQPLQPSILAQPKPDFHDPRGLTALTANNIGFTLEIPAVPSEQTQILPASIALPPSRQSHDNLWRPNGSAPLAQVRHDAQSGRVLTALPPRTAAPTAEDSYESLTVPAPATHRAAVDASWFRQGVCDETQFDRFMQSFTRRRGVLPAASGKATGSMDTQVFTAVGHGQFSTDTQERS